MRLTSTGESGAYGIPAQSQLVPLPGLALPSSRSHRDLASFTYSGPQLVISSSGAGDEPRSSGLFSKLSSSGLFGGSSQEDEGVAAAAYIAAGSVPTPTAVHRKPSRISSNLDGGFCSRNPSITGEGSPTGELSPVMSRLNSSLATPTRSGGSFYNRSNLSSLNGSPKPGMCFSPTSPEFTSNGAPSPRGVRVLPF